jgi:aspartokinase-like uncharacterized kinase
MNVDIVVKIGGSLLAHQRDLDAVLATIAAASRRVRMLIVPGGGPFADAVRDLDRRIGLSDDAAHWMAILAMDQYAHVLVDRLDGSVPVLAPSKWLREADPLPHSWDVTGDSIAAWVAGQVGAHRVVLVKPPGATGALVDAYFPRALPASVTPVVVCADRLDDLEAALSTTPNEPARP